MNVVLRYLDLNFQGHKLSRIQWKANVQTSPITFINFPLNGISANVVLCDLDLHFLRKEFDMLYFGNCDSYRKNVTIVNVVLRDLYLHFQGQTFSCNKFTIKNSADSRCPPEDLPRPARSPP